FYRYEFRRHFRKTFNSTVLCVFLLLAGRRRNLTNLPYSYVMKPKVRWSLIPEDHHIAARWKFSFDVCYRGELFANYFCENPKKHRIVRRINIRATRKNRSDRVYSIAFAFRMRSRVTAPASGWRCFGHSLIPIN